MLNIEDKHKEVNDIYLPRLDIVMYKLQELCKELCLDLHFFTFFLDHTRAIELIAPSQLAYSAYIITIKPVLTNFSCEQEIEINFCSKKIIYVYKGILQTLDFGDNRY